MRSNTMLERRMSNLIEVARRWHHIRDMEEIVAFVHQRLNATPDEIDNAFIAYAEELGGGVLDAWEQGLRTPDAIIAAMFADAPSEMDCIIINSAIDYLRQYEDRCRSDQ